MILFIQLCIVLGLIYFFYVTKVSKTTEIKPSFHILYFKEKQYKISKYNKLDDNRLIINLLKLNNLVVNLFFNNTSKILESSSLLIYKKGHLINNARCEEGDLVCQSLKISTQNLSIPFTYPTVINKRHQLDYKKPDELGFTEKEEIGNTYLDSMSSDEGVVFFAGKQKYLRTYPLEQIFRRPSKCEPGLVYVRERNKVECVSIRNDWVSAVIFSLRNATGFGKHLLPKSLDDDTPPSFLKFGEFYFNFIVPEKRESVDSLLILVDDKLASFKLLSPFSIFICDKGETRPKMLRTKTTSSNGSLMLVDSNLQFKPLVESDTRTGELTHFLVQNESTGCVTALPTLKTIIETKQGAYSEVLSCDLLLLSKDSSFVKNSFIRFEIERSTHFLTYFDKKIKKVEYVVGVYDDIDRVITVKNHQIASCNSQGLIRNIKRRDDDVLPILSVINEKLELSLTPFTYVQTCLYNLCVDENYNLKLVSSKNRLFVTGYEGIAVNLIGVNDENDRLLTFSNPFEIVPTLNHSLCYIENQKIKTLGLLNSEEGRHISQLGLDSKNGVFEHRNNMGGGGNVTIFEENLYKPYSFPEAKKNSHFLFLCSTGIKKDFIRSIPALESGSKGISYFKNGKLTTIKVMEGKEEKDYNNVCYSNDNFYFYNIIQNRKPFPESLFYFGPIDTLTERDYKRNFGLLVENVQKNAIVYKYNLPIPNKTLTHPDTIANLLIFDQNSRISCLLSKKGKFSAGWLIALNRNNEFIKYKINFFLNSLLSFDGSGLKQVPKLNKSILVCEKGKVKFDKSVYRLFERRVVELHKNKEIQTFFELQVVSSYMENSSDEVTLFVSQLDFQFKTRFIFVTLAQKYRVDKQLGISVIPETIFAYIEYNIYLNEVLVKTTNLILPHDFNKDLQLEKKIFIKLPTVETNVDFKITGILCIETSPEYIFIYLNTLNINIENIQNF